MKKLSLLISVYTLLHAVTFAQSPHAAQLYGMTQYGGSSSKGAVFHYTPSTNTFTTDYSFQMKVKGRIPKCQIITGNNGKYYGTTTAGGNYNAGVLFEWDSVTNVYNNLYEFTGSDGRDARGAMVLYNNKLYGSTNEGGANNYGVIYEWDIAANTYSKKVDLDIATGSNPTGSLTVVNNIFYGFTSTGGLQVKGVLFEWIPATNVYTKKFDFDSIKGSNPVGKLALYNGKLYAMCNKGGTFDAGTIYQWDYVNNIVTKTFDFNNTNGAYPMGYLALYNNKFYGTTNEGGIYQTSFLQTGILKHFGVIFEYNPANNAFVKKKDLGFQGDNRGPLGSLTLKGNDFWGTTSEGENGADGIFSWNPASNVFADKYSFHNWFSNPCEFFRSSMGTTAFESFLLSGNYLLGSASEGAGNGYGCIYKFSPDSNQVVSIVSMEATNGSYPKGSLTKVGHKLYGLTYQGGNAHAGNIFEWDLNTQQFAERLQFDGYTTGFNPKGSLTFYEGKLYGMNTYGKSFKDIYNSWGTRNFGGDFFSWDPATNTYQSLPLTYGSRATPTLFNNKFYNASEASPVPGGGSITAFDPSNNTTTSVAYMPENSGTYDNYQDEATANGVTYYHGKFYGMTPAKYGSFSLPFRGTIYEWDTLTTVMAERIAFVDSVGIYPSGNLTLVGDEFYGLTTGTGSSLYASLFTWKPATNVLKKKTQHLPSASGTPTYSGGKIYFLGDGSYFSLYEYDPILDTIITVHYEPISLFGPGGGWNFGACRAPLSYQQLLEVIPNELPLLSNTPAAQTLCANLTNDATFSISDADLDTMQFQIASSNTALIPVANISITNVSNNYTLHCAPIANQSGTTTITVTANDGYAGTVNFSFTITVNALPTVSSTSTPASANICEGESITLNGSGGNTYTWSGGISNNTAFAPPVGANTYTVTGTDANSCSNTNTQTVIVHALPIVNSTITPASATICEGDNVILNGTGASTYSWNNGILNNSAFIPPVGTTIYTVTGTDANGCNNTNMQTIIVTQAANPSISVSSNRSEGSIGDPIVYTANINLSGSYGINWYRNDIFQTTTVTGSWSTTIVAGNNAVKAILSSSLQCLQPDSAVSNVIDIKSIQGIVVYPNPTTGQVVVTCLLPGDDIGLYNSIGQRIITTTGKNILSDQNKLQLKNIASGAYVLFIKRNDEVFVKKIIKTNN